MKFSIKEKFLSFKELIKRLFEKFPLTLAVTYTLTTIFGLLLYSDLMDEEWFEKLIMFGFIWVPGVFFAENAFDKGKKRISVYILTGLISLIFVQLMSINEIDETIVKWLGCYLATLILGTIFIIIKKLKKEFSEYVLKIGINIIKTSFVYGIIATGIALIFSVFYFLIWKVSFKYLLNIEIFIFGFFYCSMFINAVTNTDIEVNAFFEKLVKYVLMPLLIITMSIIYLYIIKILILREIPKNIIFRITASLFVAGGLIWTCMNYFKEEGALYKFSTKLPIIFSPFILLQIYTLGIRISKNGITPLRYAGIVFIIFEVCYILCYMFKNKKIQYLILFADALLIISIIIPGINAFDISDYSQIKKLELYSQKSELTDEDKEKISGAYYYLQYTEKGKKYIKDNLNKEQINDIKNLKTSKNNSIRNNYEYINLQNNNKLYVFGYKTATKISASQYTEENIKKAFSEVNFKDDEYKNILKVDLTEKLQEYINIYKAKDEDELERFFKTNNEIRVNENQKIIISTIAFRIDPTEEKINYYSIDAYLLEK